MIDRRTFLFQGSLVLGLPLLTSRHACALSFQDTKGVLKEALARIAEQNKLGVWLVIPAANREELAAALAKQIDAGHLVFAEAVFACVGASDVRTDKETCMVVVVDSDGKRLDTLEAFDVGKICGIVHKHREKQAERCLAKVENRDAVEKAFVSLGDDDPKTREAATATLKKSLDRIVPLVSLKSVQATDDEVQSRCIALMKEHFESVGRDKPGPQLPFGMKWAEEEIDPCLGCGRMAPGPRAKTFLRFLTE